MSEADNIPSNDPSRRSGNPQPFDCSDNLVGHQFPKGKSGNPGGKTKKQVRRERENARKATIIRGEMLTRIQQQMERDPDFNPVTPNNLRLIEGSEARAYGTPRQSVDLESPNGTLSPTAVRRTIVDPSPIREDDPDEA